MADGLIPQVQGTSYTPATANASSYDATRAGSQGYTAQTGTADQASITTRQVQPDELAQTQLEKIIGSGSPLLARAQQQAMSSANERGLQNSTMAVEAGTGALIDRAMPMALQDATTYGKTASENMAAQNTGAMFNTNQKNAMTTTNLGLIGRANEFTANAANTAELNNSQVGTQAARDNAMLATQTSQYNAGQVNHAGEVGAANAMTAQVANQNSGTTLATNLLDNQTRTAVANISAESSQAVANINGRYQELINASGSARQAYTTAMEQIANIQRDPNLDGPAKDRAIQSTIAQLDDSLQVQNSISGLNLSSTLTVNGNAPTSAISGSVNNQTPATQTAAATTQDTGVQAGAVPQRAAPGTPAGAQPDGQYVGQDGVVYPSQEAFISAMNQQLYANGGV